jgi:uncharacterized protein (DUF488 family)
MSQPIYTIGYEGATLATVISTLKAAEIKTLIDVREMPVSRKPGFSKIAFAAALRAAGFEYVHLRRLGNPKPNRHLRDRHQFEMVFKAHLNGDAAKRELAEAERLAAGARACLMCFEADAADCHRTIVAEAMARNLGLDVHHLKVSSSREGETLQLPL